MINKIKILLLSALFLTANSCKKDDVSDPPVTTPLTSQKVLEDFTNVLAIPNYTDLKLKAGLLNQDAITLSANPTEQNLATARDAWRNVRAVWEQAEGYLFGPVQDFNYDPATDSWPVNTVELDSLLGSNNPLEVANIDSFQYTLKGYHPVEYVLFGVGGSRTAAQLTARELKYLTSLTESLYNTVSQLVVSWDVNVPGNFATELMTAGNGSIRYATRKDAFIAIANAMKHICDEVANNKMEVPLVAHDSELVESQYAHNATTDFSNNIRGVQNVYMCSYTSTGKSLHDLVTSKNLSLANNIQSQITIALNALDLINPNYGVAIFSQQSQILNAQNEINNLESSIDLFLNFIQTNVTD